MKDSSHLDEHFRFFDNMLQKILGNTQWAIYDQRNTTCYPHSSFLFSSSEPFSHLCQQVGKFYGQFSQESDLISLNYQNKRLSYQLRRLLNDRYPSLLILPLVDQQGCLGRMYVNQPDKQDDWDEEAINTLKAIAQQIIFTIRQHEQLEQFKRKEQQQQLIEALYACFNQQETDTLPWEQILSLIAQYYQVEQVVLLRFLENQTVVIEQEWRKNDNIPAWQAIEHLESSCTIKSYQYINYTLEIGRNSSSNPSVALSVSLKSRNKCFGRLVLQTFDRHRRFSTEEIHFLETVGNMIAIFGVYYQFNQTLWQLEQKNSAKGEFLSYMTHELRTPLSGILGFARMLNKELYGKLNAKQKEYVTGIVTSGEHLLSLVNDFLDFSKLEAQKEELVLEPMVVEELCQSVFAIVQSKATEQGLDLILDIANNIDICTADQRRIKQILLNLLSNAIKFTDNGFVTLKVMRDQSNLFFSVIDTGIGIKEEDQGKLFEPFEQIKSKLTHKQKGTGLGLTISRQLAQLHGGDLTFTSQEGQGSCFTLSLPQKPIEES